jgi:N-methylhydantoinase A
LRLSSVDAAQAILDVTVNNLVEAIELVSVQRGYDPRAFALVAFGGAGPMYAVDVARLLEIPDVVVPPAPGVTSALGLLQVELAMRSQRPVLMREGVIDPERVGSLFQEMEDVSRAKLAAAGYPAAEVRREVDVRYFGQSRYMTIDAPGGRWSDAATSAVIASFSEEHKREFGYLMPPEVSEIELVNLRVVVHVPLEKSELRFTASLNGVPHARQVHLKGVGFAEVPIHERSSLPPALPVEGPAIIEQTDATIVLLSGSTGQHDERGNFLIRV